MKRGLLRPLAKSAWRRGLELGVSVLLGLLGLKLGYDFGLRLAGVWLGVIMGINAGLFGALAASIATDRLFRHWRTATRPPGIDKPTPLPGDPGRTASKDRR